MKLKTISLLILSSVLLAGCTKQAENKPINVIGLPEGIMTEAEGELEAEEEPEVPVLTDEEKQEQLKEIFGTDELNNSRLPEWAFSFITEQEIKEGDTCNFIFTSHEKKAKTTKFKAYIYEITCNEETKGIEEVSYVLADKDWVRFYHLLAISQPGVQYYKNSKGQYTPYVMSYDNYENQLVTTTPAPDGTVGVTYEPVCVPKQNKKVDYTPCTFTIEKIEEEVKDEAKEENKDSKK